jgi:MYXO-CTERM domain-containing protein
MKMLAGMALLMMAMAVPALALLPAPEIDPGSAGTALTILIGLSLVRRRRRKA